MYFISRKVIQFPPPPPKIAMIIIIITIIIIGSEKVTLIKRGKIVSNSATDFSEN